QTHEIIAGPTASHLKPGWRRSDVGQTRSPAATPMSAVWSRLQTSRLHRFRRLQGRAQANALSLHPRPVTPAVAGSRPVAPVLSGPHRSSGRRVSGLGAVCHYAQGGGVSSIRKTGGSVFGTTSVA